MNLTLNKEDIALTAAQAAEILGVSERTLTRYRTKGLLPYYKPVKKVYIMYSDLLGCLGKQMKKQDSEVSNG